ncbi:MAG: hypothetical protein Q8J74_10110 [Candidatus Didemnitutus sp.]|nr:hypothetical protein [Candidatus Didemnitutus sp.]
MLVVAVIVSRYFQRDRPAASSAPAVPPAGPRTEAQELVARMWGIYDKVDDTSNEEWELAEELGARATKLEPLNAEAWAAYANVISMPYIFGIDSSPERVARATKSAERAVSIAPESVQTRLALANVRRRCSGLFHQAKF